MTRQNIYDDLRFSQGYTKLRASGLGLNEQLEHPAIDSLLPSLWGVDLLDIGCGDGSRTVDYVRRGARSAIGVDPSQRMLASAVKHDRVDYQRAFIEDLRYEDNSFDLVVASMSLHYVEGHPRGTWKNWSLVAQWRFAPCIGRTSNSQLSSESRLV